MVYRPGLWKCVCDICGFTRYNTEMRKTWNNLLVCADTCYDGPRSPLDFPPPLPHERPGVPNPRPRYKDRPHVLETTEVTSITDTTAASGGNVVHDGGSTVTEYGVCWSTDHAPDTDDDRTSDGTGTGEFSSNITSLTASTTYYVRAYAKNAIGTSYGPEIEFTTTA